MNGPSRLPGPAEMQIPLRLAVYTDYAYHRLGDAVYAERAFALFLAELSRRLERTVVAGRLDPAPARARYPLGESVEFAALPHYPSLAHPVRAIRGMAGSLRRWWRALDGVDCVWLLGPHPLIPAFALLARLRGKGVALGVRQDFPSYVRSRRPGRPLFAAVAAVLERLNRLLARRFPVVVVGPELARTYRGSPRLLEIAVSLVRSDRIEAGGGGDGGRRSYTDRLRILSVGRLDAEKNPLLLVETLARLRREDPRWTLTVCGEGPMSAQLATRAAELGVREAVELRGYVPLDRGLEREYRDSHVLLHCSWTEGLPQVLFEAFAAGLPVVASDVGGIAEAVGEAARVVPPGDPGRAADELRRVAEDGPLRERLVEAGARLAREHTIEAETRRVAEFLGRSCG